jgi:hypothetical protein
MSGKKRNRNEQPEQPEQPKLKKLRMSPDTDIWISVKEKELELNIHEKHDTPVKYGLLLVCFKMLIQILLSETQLYPHIAGIIGEYVGNVTFKTIPKKAYSKIQAHFLDYDYLCIILDGKMYNGQSSYKMIHLAIELASYALKLKKLDHDFTNIYKQLIKVWKLTKDKVTGVVTGLYSSVNKIADALQKISFEFLLVRGTPDAIPFISTRTRLTGFTAKPTMWDFTICIMHMMTKFDFFLIRDELLSKLRVFDDFEDEGGIVGNAMISVEHRNTMRNIGAHQSVGRQLAIMVDKTLTDEKKRKLLKIESVKTHQENTVLEETLQKYLKEIGYGK